MSAKYRSPYRKEYHSKRLKVIASTAILIVVLVAMMIYSLSVNNFKVSFQEAITVIINRINGVVPETYIDRMIDYVVMEDNAPRAVAALEVGTILAISGAVMQTLTRNPLAEPYTIGISSAAMFGVTISLVLGISLIPGLNGDVATGVNAFIMAMVPAVVIVLATSFRKLSPNMMILIGIGMMYLFTSVTTLLKFNASDEKLHEIYIWSLGTLGKMENWNGTFELGVAAVVLFVFFVFYSKKINVIMAGDDISHTLGVNPFKLRMLCFLVVSFGVAVAVRYTGTIGFVGLVAPHITRLFTGNNNKLLIPLSALSGTLLILLGDIVVRMLPGGLPAGVITALIGSPLFLYFLFKQRTKSTF